MTITELLDRVEALDKAAERPCPFCGSTKIVKGERYFAMCVDCGATGPERNADATERKFMGDWNKRVTLTPKLANALRLAVDAIEASNQTLEGFRQGFDEWDMPRSKDNCARRIAVNEHTLAAITAALAKGTE